MVGLVIDYKKTTQKSPCKLCNRLIVKGQRRVKLVGANDKYVGDHAFFHLSCFLEKCHSFVDEIPVNELEFGG